MPAGTPLPNTVVYAVLGEPVGKSRVPFRTNWTLPPSGFLSVVPSPTSSTGTGVFTPCALSPSETNWSTEVAM